MRQSRKELRRRRHRFRDIQIDVEMCERSDYADRKSELLHLFKETVLDESTQTHNGVET